MKISSQIPSIRISPELAKALEKPSQAQNASSNFGDMLKEKISDVDTAIKTADQATQSFATGKSRNIHEAVLAMEMADTSLRMAVAVRNKVIDAYQEIMRMPV